jgi:outer membrane receptor for ferrienterochelin and colicins
VPYVIVGAMAEHKIATHVKLFLSLENLSNVRQTRWDALLLRNRESDGRWTVDAWAPLDGRVINGGARFVFWHSAGDDGLGAVGLVDIKRR